MKNLAYAIRPLALDMLSTLFFAGVFALTHNLYAATGLGIAIGIGQISYLLFRGRKVAALQWASVGLVIVMGVAAIVTNDPRFVMIKPTIIYVVVAASMLQPGWMTRYVPPAAQEHLPRRLIVGAGYGWAALMALTAVLNLYFAFATSAATWAAFLAIFPMASKLTAFAIQYGAFRVIAIRNARSGASASSQAIAAA
ncbi:MAG TPA: septation protein IspZ [Caulobacteraceae bacterium]|nr:septation protein IspZ [Caulobacteraceae bacterium]